MIFNATNTINDGVSTDVTVLIIEFIFLYNMTIMIKYNITQQIVPMKFKSLNDKPKAYFIL